MFLKALDIPEVGPETAPSDLVCRPWPQGAANHTIRAAEDPYLDLAVELMVKRGPLVDADAAELVCRVRRARAVANWRGLKP